MPHANKEDRLRCNRESMARRGERNKHLINMYKTEAGCKVCGERRHWVLDLHHRDPETKTIRRWADLIKYSKKRVIEEMLLCDVLCANCHRDHHTWERRDVRSDSQDRGSDA